MNFVGGGNLNTEEEKLLSLPKIQSDSLAAESTPP
jgi:hypothetical protein